MPTNFVGQIDISFFFYLEYDVCEQVDVSVLRLRSYLRKLQNFDHFRKIGKDLIFLGNTM